MAAVANPANVIVSGKDSPLERRCENTDCNVYKLVSMVPKRKTPQFVTHPSIIEKPMLVNGFTTIFQVDGVAAKKSDLKPLPNGDPKTIYRIIPNTHAHIVNYVVVDTEGESMRKINSGDPTTMKKLLESQRVSAEQMLSKLMNGQGCYMQVSNTTTTSGVPKITMQKAASGSTPNQTSTSALLPTVVGALTEIPPTAPAKLPMRSVTIKKVPYNSPVATQPTTKTTISTPTPTLSGASNIMRLNSSLKVRAIPSGTTQPTSRASAPFIKTVPLSQLQQQPTTPIIQKTDASNPIASSTPITAGPASENNSMFEKMQKELEELRRTVSFLAESQKKTQTQQSPADKETTEMPASKKLRLK